MYAARPESSCCQTCCQTSVSTWSTCGVYLSPSLWGRGGAVPSLGEGTVHVYVVQLQQSCGCCDPTLLNGGDCPITINTAKFVSPDFT